MTSAAAQSRRKLRAAMTEAHGAGLAVRLEDLGDWFPAALFSEFDARARTVAVNVRIARAFRRTHGPAFAREFVAAAIVHETAHASGADEAAAHTAVAASGHARETYVNAWRALCAGTAR